MSSRRAFLLAAAGVFAPLGAKAQRGSKMATIGVISPAGCVITAAIEPKYPGSSTR